MKKTTDINKDGHIGWRELDFRDKVAYTMAIILIASGIIMAFLCFFLTGDYAKKEKALVHAFLGKAVARKDYGICDDESPPMSRVSSGR